MNDANESATIFTYDKLRDLTVLLCRERGNSAAQALLWEFGNHKLINLPGDLWPEFVRIAVYLLHTDRRDFRDVVREQIVSHAWRYAKPQNTTKPKRAPLAYFTEQQERAIFDRFPGYRVISVQRSDDTFGEHSHVLQRVADLDDPLHASAFLKA
jgi:hypothetical protein